MSLFHYLGFYAIFSGSEITSQRQEHLSHSDKFIENLPHRMIRTTNICEQEPRELLSLNSIISVPSYSTNYDLETGHFLKNIFLLYVYPVSYGCSTQLL